MKSLIFKMALMTCVTLSSNIFGQGVVTKAVAVIHPTEKNATRGVVTFTSESGGVHIVADIVGLTPGEHGFHIHEYGDCSALDANSAGGHFNPTNKRHGCPNDPEHHVGDMGNLTADKEGHAHYDAMSKDIRLEGDNRIIGRAIIIHQGRDDCKSQPTGDAGARLGCGVIGIASNPSK